MWEIVFILFCIILNAFFAGIEIAFVSVDKILVKQRAKEGDKKAIKLLQLKEMPERTLSTIQIGTTLLGSLTAAVGGAAAGISLLPVLEETFKLSLPVAEIIAVLLVVVPITYLSVVIGEITPKSLALKNPYFFASLGVPILSALGTFLYPVVRLCEKSTKILLKMIPFHRIKEGNGERKFYEYEELLTSYRKLPQKGKEYMVNLSNIQDKAVEDIMLGWDQVDYVTVSQGLDEIVEKIISSGHTRMPVVDSGRVIGLINTKEILAFSRGKDSNWIKLMRTPVKFKRDAFLLDSLNVLQGKQVHMGIVEGRDHKPVGVITIEDIIEEVLGEIYDEDDRGSLQRILSTN